MRTRSDSTGFAVAQAKAMATLITAPPQQLDAEALQYWPAIIGAKRATAWTDADLLQACQLARDMALIETLSSDLATDGHVLSDNKGKKYAHPAANLLDQASRRIIATARAIQVSAIATTGKTDHQGKKNEAARAIAGKLDNVHDLIPRARTSDPG